MNPAKNDSAAEQAEAGFRELLEGSTCPTEEDLEAGILSEPVEESALTSRDRDRKHDYPLQRFPTQEKTRWLSN